MSDNKTICRGNNVVNHPGHYTEGIETIKYIESWGLNFSRGNAIKYITRAGKKIKSKELEDLEKAKWYIDREIRRLKNEARKHNTGSK